VEKEVLKLDTSEEQNHADCVSYRATN
jgi:hypothetical protein